MLIASTVTLLQVKISLSIYTLVFQALGFAPLAQRNSRPAANCALPVQLGLVGTSSGDIDPTR